MRWRKPTPTALRVLRGDRPPAPLETDPATGIPPKPGTIAGDPEASAEWDRMAGLMQARDILTHADLGILLVYCDGYSRLVAARAELARDGLIVSTAAGAAKWNPAATAAAVAARELRAAAAELGATPTARARVAAAEPPPRDDLEEFLAKRPDSG